MQVVVNSLNIGTFRFKVQFNIYTRQVTFTDISTYNNMSGHGSLYVQGIAFSLIDQDGVALASIDWTNPQIPTPATNPVYVLDLSGSVNFAFLFQNYSIVGAIKDADGTVYSTPLSLKSVCQPVSITDSGYVPGMFQLIPDCINNNISVKDLTPFVYNNLQPSSPVTKTGILSYPTGTISPVTFTGTPFSNNVIYTGEYRIACTSVAEYNLQDDFYVDVTYLTNCPFDITCANRMADILCCIEAVQNTYQKNCNNAIGANAKNLLNEIAVPLMSGFIAESNGQDASAQALFIKKTLSCNCGVSSLSQNELTPVNPSVYSIVVTGINATTVTPSTNGSTQTFTVSTNIVSVVKGNPADVAFTLAPDNTTPGNTKWVITFNYNAMAGYILTAIAGNNTLIAQLNSLVTQVTNIDLSNLNGECVINLSSVNYFLSQLLPNGSSVLVSILIGSTTYNAPGGLLVSNVAGVEAWLNGLGFGTFDAGFSNSMSGAYFNLSTVGNANSPMSVVINISGSNTTIMFQKTNKSLIAVLQAIIDYLCGLTSLQVALGNNLGLCYFDYNGNIVISNYTTASKQNDFNAGISTAICNIANRIKTLTAVTCATIQALFQDYPNASFGVNDRVLSIINGNCTSATDLQIGNMVIAAINKYPSLKTAYCAINCTTPATCPDIASSNITASSNTISIYGLDWTITPLSAQVVTVKYRVTGTTTWTIATTTLNILPNGNISGTSPYVIHGLSGSTTYDVQIINNCGGVGLITQTSTSTGGVYSGNFLLDNTLYNLCGETQMVLYSNAPFGTGVQMFTNSGLTTPLTGYTYISAATGGGNIYTIGTSNGIVGTNTGLSCSNGTSGSYLLGNTVYNLCGGSPITLYTNGAFTTGGTLYTDASLTNPITGYIYVAMGLTGTIYNLNSSTGVIGSPTGLLCGTQTIGLNISPNPPGTNFTINSVTVGGILATPNGGLSYPIFGGQTASVTTNEIGTASLSVNFSLNFLAVGHSIRMTITASGGGGTITNTYSSAGTYTLTLPSAQIDNFVSPEITLAYI